MIRCVDEYRPRNVKTGNHGELTVHVADWSPPKPGEASMRWRRVKRTAKTLTEAKKIAAKVLAENPQFCPTGAPI